MPSGWTESQLINLLEALESGSRPKGGVRGITSGIPSIGGEHLNDEGGFDFSNIKFVPERFAHGMTKGKISTGDILIVKDGATTGKTSYVSKDFPHKTAFVNEHVFICRTIQRLDSKYLYWYLRSKEGNERMMENFKGSAQGGINQSFASNTLVPIAPLPEQQRIVAKLDELMAKIDRSRARLERIPQILKRFRQSVLSAAARGQLSNSESEWREVNLGSLVKKGDIFDGPFGSSLKTSDYTDKGIRVIRLENIEHLYFVNEKETFISKDKYQTLLRHTVGEGDIIFSSFITEEIRACMLPKLANKAIAKADCFCIRPNEELVNKQFLLYALVSSNSYNQLILNIHGATRPRINTSQLKELTLSLPELDEQAEIVKRVAELFSFADKIEARYNKAKAQLDKLPQSLLAKAFRGELVPQDENDEPASVLLGRIKGEEAGTGVLRGNSTKRRERALV